jgi:hypothetical protein
MINPVTQVDDYPIDHAPNNSAAALCGLVLAYGEDHQTLAHIQRSAMYHALRAGGDDVIELRHAIRHNADIFIKH